MLQKQLKHLGSMDEPVVAKAFEALYRLAGPPQPSGEQAPGQEGLSVAHAEAAEAPDGAEVDFDPLAWGDGLNLLDIDLWPGMNWFDDDAQWPFEDGAFLGETPTTGP